MLRRTAALVALLALTSCFGESSNRRSDTGRSGAAVVGVKSLGELDPARGDWNSFRIIATACDGLTRLKGERTAPALASRWEASDGGRTFRFDIRKAGFTDGSVVQAADVSESLARIVRPETGSPWAHLLRLVDGFQEVASGAARHLSGIRVVDANTLEIHTLSPHPELPSLLAHPALVIAKEGGVCAGPYQMNVQGEAVVLTALDSPGLPREGRLQRIEFRVGSEGQVVELQDGAATPEAHQLVMRVSNEIEYLDVAGDALSFNARHALSAGLGRLVIIDAAFGDSRKPALGWRPRKYETGKACGTVGLVADSERARQLWETTQLGQTTIPLRYADASGSGRVVQAMQQQLQERLGIRVETHLMSPVDFDAADKAQPGLWLRTRQRTFPVDLLSLSDLAPQPEVQQALEEARSTLQAEVRASRYDEVEAMICEDMTKIPLWTKVDRWSYNAREIGFPPDVQLDAYGSLPMREAFAR